MSLNSASHKAARNKILSTLGLSNLGDRMIHEAEKSYASGKRATPYLAVKLPKKWRRTVPGVNGRDLAHMVAEVLREDRRLDKTFVQFTSDMGVLGFWGGIDYLILNARDLPTGTSR